MKIPNSKLHLLVHILLKGDLRYVLNKIKQHLYSTSLAYGLRRDLEKPFEAPEAMIPIQIASAHDGSVLDLLDSDAYKISSLSLWQRYRRILLFQFGIRSCFIGLTDGSKICYVQWLMPHTENDKIQAFFGTQFPILKEDEALLEGAFIPESFRGRRIMPDAMSQVAEKGTEVSARYAITFVGVENIPSLKGCVRSGFKPYLWREDRYRFFRHTTRFYKFAEDDAFPVPYDRS